MNRLKLFLLGWRRRSALLLDNAGCPLWLTRRRCPPLQGWGRLLSEMADDIAAGRLSERGEHVEP